MRSVRCDACGTKALMAASQCPKCGHGFEVRDGFGELLPLSHCSTCDSYYPTKLGACRWCGTQPERAPIAPYVWKGAGVLAFVAMAWGAWLVHDDPSEEVAAARMSAILKPDSSLSRDLVAAGSLDTAIPGATPVGDSTFLPDTTAVVSLPVDSLNEPLATVVAAMDAPATPSQPATTVVVPVDSAPPPVDPTPVAEPVREPVVAESIPASPPAEAPVRASPRSGERSATPAPARTTTRTLARAPVTPGKKPTTKAAAKHAPSSKAAVKTPAKAVAKAPARPTSKSRTRVVWVNTISRNWVVVRAGASRTARVIASIGPNTRVQLGEARGGWRRIRAKGLSGWVEHRSFFATATPPRGVGRVAAR